MASQRPPRSLFGKDHAGVGFRIRAPPRDGGIRFGNPDDLGQNADKESVDLVRVREDSGEGPDEVLEIGTVAGIAEGSGLPWVTIVEEVEENDAE